MWSEGDDAGKTANFYIQVDSLSVELGGRPIPPLQGYELTRHAISSDLLGKVRAAVWLSLLALYVANFSFADENEKNQWEMEVVYDKQ